MPQHPPATHPACVALGANLGDRDAALRAALDALDATPGVRVERISAFHETEAVTLDGAPQPPYRNAAALLSTTLPPEALLERLLEIERDLGRRREGEPRWAARTIDLDLLLYADEIIDRPGLRVPHPRMHERRFVLAPLAEIAPDWPHPARKRTVRRMLADLDAPARRRPPAPAVLCALCVAAIHPVAGAQAPEGQPVPEPTPEARAWTPEEALSRMRQAYTGEPLGERMQIVVRSDDGAQRDALTLRMAPGAVRVDFRDMAAGVFGEGVVIAHPRSLRGYLPPASAQSEERAAVERLLDALPPLPLPQLDIALHGPGATDIDPLCRDLRWFSATAVEGLLLIEGVGPACSVSLAVDLSTWRLDSATLRGRAGENPISVESHIEPFDPGPIEQWRLDPASMTIVQSLADLAPREGDVRPGDPAPDLLLLTPDGAPWRLTDALREEGRPVALLLFREEAPGVRAAAQAVERVLERAPGALAFIPAAVLPPAGVEPLARLDELASRWSDGLLWTVSHESTLNRFAPDSAGALALIGADGVVRDVVTIDHQIDTDAPLADRIERALGLEQE